MDRLILSGALNDTQSMIRLVVSCCGGFSPILKSSEALGQTQLKVMEQFPEPFYWAAHQLTGEPS